MFEKEKFWYKKCFATNRNDSRINKVFCSVKLEAKDILMTNKGLNFTFSIA